MKIYFKQERLGFARKSSLRLRIISKEYNCIFCFFALIPIPHKRFNRTRFLLKNYKKLKFTLDIYDYMEFNDFNIILENSNLINYIFDNCFLRSYSKDRDSRLIKKWRQKNIINT